MKKLFGKIAAAMFGLLTFCAPIHAELGTMYVGNEVAFKLFGVDKWVGEEADTTDLVPYVISDFRSGEEEELYSIAERSGGYDHINIEERALWKKGAENDKKFLIYKFKFANGLISRSVRHNDPQGPSVHNTRFLAAIHKENERDRTVYARNKDKDGNFVKGYSKILFKTSYFKSDRRPNEFPNDSKDKFFSGYYIKRADGSIAAKVIGDYFPIDLVAMLVLNGDLKI